VKHGAASAYRKGCRCDQCREWSAASKRRWRAGDGPGKTPAGQQSHGAWAYKHWACRCDVCTAANTTQMREYLERRRRNEGVLKRRWAS
jgi:hypothetical protein